MAEKAVSAGDPGASGISVPDPAQCPCLKSKVCDVEWQLRCALAALYRLVALYGWDDLIFTHISARLPDHGEGLRFLINPYGVLFDEMTASSLLTVDETGAVIGDTPYLSNPAGFTIHSAVHMARDDAHCVLHLHTPYGVAVSAQEAGLRRYSQFAMIVGNDVAYHDYEGIATDHDERARIVSDLGDRNFLMLRNHGTLTLGPNPPIAFLRMYFLEQACRAQILAQAGGTTLREETEAMGEKVQGQGAPAFIPGLGDRLAWPGLLRKLSRENPGWDV